MLDAGPFESQRDSDAALRALTAVNPANLAIQPDDFLALESLDQAAIAAVAAVLHDRGSGRGRGQGAVAAAPAQTATPGPLYLAFMDMCSMAKFAEAQSGHVCSLPSCACWGHWALWPRTRRGGGPGPQRTAAHTPFRHRRPCSLALMPPPLRRPPTTPSSSLRSPRPEAPASQQTTKCAAVPGTSFSFLACRFASLVSNNEDLNSLKR